MRYCPEDLQTADNMARVCRMRKQVLGKQHAEILLRARNAKKNKTANGQSLRPLALQLKQMKQQMNKLEEVEMNFLNIASISQTTGALQTITEQYNTGHVSRENVDIDEVLDLQDALREQQETFAEIDKALAEQWMPMEDLSFSGGGPSSGPGTSREKLLEQELGDNFAVFFRFPLKERLKLIKTLVLQRATSQKPRSKRRRRKSRNPRKNRKIRRNC
tara:strand:+ start:558 stop:1211 length:654 start_codon:yes stop_codon:yes gene_type:complete